MAKTPSVECTDPDCGCHFLIDHIDKCSLCRKTRKPAPTVQVSHEQNHETVNAKGYAEQAAPPRPLNACQECGGDNPVWFAPSEVWNKVFPGRTGFVCPNCFLKKAEPLFSDVTGWEIRPEKHSKLLDEYRADIDRHTAAKDFDSLWTTAESLFAALETYAAPAAIEQARPQTRLHQVNFFGGDCCVGCGQELTEAEYGKECPAAAEPAPERTPPQGFVTLKIEDLYAWCDPNSGVKPPLEPCCRFCEQWNFKHGIDCPFGIAIARAVAVPEPAPTPRRVKILEGVIRNFEGYQEMGRTVLYAQIETALKALAGAKEEQMEDFQVVALVGLCSFILGGLILYFGNKRRNRGARR